MHGQIILEHYYIYKRVDKKTELCRMIIYYELEIANPNEFYK